MYVIGAGALSEFANAHPLARSALGALAARLGAESFASADALATALGEHASADGSSVTIEMPWCDTRVRLACDAGAQLVIITSVQATSGARKK